LEVAINCLLVECAKFAPHVMMSDEACFNGNGKKRLRFVEERDKINTDYYINDLLPNLVKDCHHLLGNNLVRYMSWLSL